MYTRLSNDIIILYTNRLGLIYRVKSFNVSKYIATWTTSSYVVNESPRGFYFVVPGVSIMTAPL